MLCLKKTDVNVLFATHILNDFNFNANEPVRVEVEV